MEAVHEFIKTQQSSASSEQLAVDALNADSDNFKKVAVAENTHKLLKKKVIEGSKYYEAAKALFKYSVYFEGA